MCRYTCIDISIFRVSCKRERERDREGKERDLHNVFSCVFILFFYV